MAIWRGEHERAVRVDVVWLSWGLRDLMPNHGMACPVYVALQVGSSPVG